MTSDRELLHAMAINTKHYITTMRCADCGHEYQLEPAEVVADKDGYLSRYFGSAYDFCPRCEGIPEELLGAESDG